jgi:hypothetical protein
MGCLEDGRGFAFNKQKSRVVLIATNIRDL